MKFRKFEALLVALLVVFLGACVLLETEAADLSGRMVRLRVVANSDRADDQALKLEVRDAVLALAEQCCAGTTDRAEAEQRLRAALPTLKAAAEQVVDGRYEVRIYLEDEVYATRDYEGFSLPAGTYRSLRVELGAAAGQNWWCCIFPPLCTAAAMGSLEEAAEAGGFSADDVALVTEQDGYVLKFKALELWQWFKERFLTPL